MEDEFGTTLALREWDEAWAQSRHLENMRAQYLGFFFTATLAVTAVLAKPLADNSLVSSGSFVALGALSLGLQVLASVTYVAVVRMNTVLSYYQRLIYAIKKQTYEKYESPVDLTSSLGWPQSARRGRAARLSTTQGTAELVLQLALSIFPLVLLGGVVRAAIVLDVFAPSTVLCGVALLASVSAGASSAWAAAGSRHPTSEKNMPVVSQATP